MCVNATQSSPVAVFPVVDPFGSAGTGSGCNMAGQARERGQMELEPARKPPERARDQTTITGARAEYAD